MLCWHAAQQPIPMTSSTGKKIAAAVVATALSLGLAEVALRLFVPTTALGALSYVAGDGTPVKDVGEALTRHLVVPVPPDQTPRERYQFAPDQTFWLRYGDNARLRRSWLDADGQVAVHINRFGLRERDDLTPDKPPGQRRIVCIGDSFTFGWGIPVEQGWVRLLEDDLRREGLDLRTVNCGASGALCVDEYEWGLRTRFGRFQPDAVIVTICLNDLIPSCGLTVEQPVRRTGIRVVDLVLAATAAGPLDLDPEQPWVDELLKLSQQDAEAAQLAGRDKPFEAMWSQGVPQRSLRAMKAWCDERNVTLMVVLWPFLQGLGPARRYPFAKLHTLVAADCEAAGIPFLDVLPALAGTDQEDLWVTPADQHANPKAQQLALPSIVAFVRQHAAFLRR